MTPQEKAKQLVEKFSKLETVNGKPILFTLSEAKQCALIAVDEILEWERVNFGTDTKATQYWQQVKKEMEKL